MWRRKLNSFSFHYYLFSSQIFFTVGAYPTPLRDGCKRGGGNQQDSGEEWRQTRCKGLERTPAQLLFYEQGGHFAAAGGRGEVNRGLKNRRCRGKDLLVELSSKGDNFSIGLLLQLIVGAYGYGNQSNQQTCYAQDNILAIFPL